MAVRKETTRQQFTEAAAPLLEHGEQVVAGTLGRTGPSPWLSSAFGLLGFAVFALFGLRFYYLLVTDRRVLWLKVSMTGRHAGLAFADPRTSVGVAGIRKGAAWSRLGVTRPDGRRLTLHVHRAWRDDMEAVAEALGGTPDRQPAAR